MILMHSIYKIVKGGLIKVCTVSAKYLTVPKLVYKFSIFPGAMIPVHLSLNVI